MKIELGKRNSVRAAWKIVVLWMPDWEEMENGTRSHAACQCWICNDISSQEFMVVLYSSGKNFTNLASEMGSRNGVRQIHWYQ